MNILTLIDPGLIGCLTVGVNTILIRSRGVLVVYIVVHSGCPFETSYPVVGAWDDVMLFYSHAVKAGPLGLPWPSHLQGRRREE